MVNYSGLGKEANFGGKNFYELFEAGKESQ
jgi:hypothetical protein